jgi:hypothetical protein
LTPGLKSPGLISTFALIDAVFGLNIGPDS